MHVHITSHTLNNASVTIFIKTLGNCTTIPIVNADMVHDCESTGRIIILSIHNTLYFKEMNHNLIPTFMMRLYGFEVDKGPKFLACNPT